MSDFQPLGPAIRPKPAEKPEEWRALDPSKPHIQTNTKTGAMRNNRPTPAVEQPFWFYMSPPTP